MKSISKLLMTVALVGTTSATAAVAEPAEPWLEGRAVLGAATVAAGPPSGAALAPPGETITLNGIVFPRRHQPVQGFSAVVAGRHPGEFLAMPDNGFGGKTNSGDFLIRAYYIEPDFKTARGGTGGIVVGDHIQFRDPNSRFGFDIVNKATTERLLTGGDIDPESLQRDKNGDYWMGDEFGPWLLHFDAAGVLLEAPIGLPGVLSPNNPAGPPSTHPNSRGFEAMAMPPTGRFLYAALEGPSGAETDLRRRRIVEFDSSESEFTGLEWTYLTEHAGHLVSDMWALDQHRMVVIERDAGAGLLALFRRIYLIDLRETAADGSLVKHLAVDLTAVGDPDGVSLPAIHDGDVGLGDPFRVTCESVEIVHVIDGGRLLVGCDNNLPNKGRNPGRADDTELIVVRAPSLAGGGAV